MQRFTRWMSPSSARPARTARLQVEPLEDRWMPATLQIVNGLLTYTAGAGIANGLKIAISPNALTPAGNYVFTDTQETISAPGLQGSGTHTVTFPTGLVSSMRINLADKADALLVEATLAPITVQAGDGDDTIDVGKPTGGTLGAIKATVTVDGQAGSDTLRVNDADSASHLFVVTATQVTSGAAGVVYAGVERLTVNTAALGDTFFVRSTAAGTTTALNAGGSIGGNTFNVGNLVNTLDDIKGPLQLHGGIPTPGPITLFVADTVNLFDTGSAAANSYVVRDNSVSRSGGVVVSYSDVESVRVNAGSAADSALVVATSATGVVLNMGGGNDTVEIGTRTGTSLDPIVGTVAVNGQDGTDAIILNDQTAAAGNTYVVTATDVTRDGRKILSYAAAESLTLNAGAFADTATVRSSLAATPVTLKMGGGDDFVNVGGDVPNVNPATLTPIQGVVSVDGQTGSDRLTVWDFDVKTGVDYTVTATTVSRPGAAPVTYAGLEDLILVGASGDAGPLTVLNTFLVKSTSVATSINVGGSFRRQDITIGNDANSLDDIHGALNFFATGSQGYSVLLKDQGDASGNGYAIVGDSVARSGAATISWDILGSLNNALLLNAGPASDNVLITNAPRDAFVTLNMGAGDDTVTLNTNPNTLNSNTPFMTVNTGFGHDAVVVNDTGVLASSGNDYLVTATGVFINNHSLLNYFAAESLTVNAGPGPDFINVLSTAATTPVIVRGGGGNDLFRVGNTNATGLFGSVTLDGQGGSDTLDYTPYTVGVRVNLALGTATGVVGGLSNIENANGGQADDILVGNDQANVLLGEGGRDILIGRGGADFLFGQADDDILVGGSTLHDLNPVALEQLMSEWGRRDLTGTPEFQYAIRVLHLFGFGVGNNGTTLLNPSNVVDDGAADHLDGGTGLDWFFQFSGDTIAALEAAERVN
jgi:hypothetical protein